MKGGGKKPSLRFREFRDASAWTPRKLSDLLFETKVRNRNLEYGACDVLSVSGEFGCVNQISLLGRSYAGASVEDYHVVETGDLVYTKSPLKRNPYGIIKGNRGKAGIVSTLYAVYRPRDTCCADYLDQYFSRDFNLNSYLQPIVNKGAKNDMKVNNSDVLSGEVWAPQPEEQRQIANFLNSLDEVIATEGQKLKTLKAHKKGLVQQLFPREGETIPLLRFPEFQDAPGWEEKVVGDLGEVVTGNTPSTAKAEYYGGSIPFVSPADISDLRFVGGTNTTLTESGFAQTRPIRANSVLFVCIGSSIGKVAQNLWACATNQQINSVVPNSSHVDAFVYYCLVRNSHRIARLAGRHAVPIVNKTQFSSVTLPVPELREQQRIGDCLSALDDLAAAQSDKLKALRSLKMGLTQQLFPCATATDA